MQPIQFFAARAEDGALVPGATVDVFVAGTQTRAALFADSLGSVPLINPVLADKNARVFFYSAITRIDILIHRGGYVGPLMRDVVVTDPDDVLALTNGLYRTIAQGLAKTISGQIFQVISPDDEAAYAIYENVSGTAVDTGKRVPARYLLDKVAAEAQLNADAARAYAEGAQAYAGRNFGPLPHDPSANPLGDPLAAGDRYFNSTTRVERVFDGVAWYTPNADGQAIQQAFASAGGMTLIGTPEHLAGLRNLAPPSVAPGRSFVVFVSGHSVPYDGGEGNWYWQGNSNEVDDNAMVIRPASNQAAGRWKRAQRDFVRPEDFGAKGDFSWATQTGTVNTAALQAMLNWCSKTGAEIRPLPGKKYLTDTLRLYRHATLNPGWTRNAGRTKIVGQANGHATGALEDPGDAFVHVNGSAARLLECTGTWSEEDPVDMGGFITLQDFAFVGGNATTDVIKFSGCAGNILRTNVRVMVRNPAGNGITESTTWAAIANNDMIWGSANGDGSWTGTGLLITSDGTGGQINMKTYIQTEIYRLGYGTKIGRGAVPVGTFGPIVFIGGQTAWSDQVGMLLGGGIQGLTTMGMQHEQSRLNGILIDSQGANDIPRQIKIQGGYLTHCGKIQDGSSNEFAIHNVDGVGVEIDGVSFQNSRSGIIFDRSKCRDMKIRRLDSRTVLPYGAVSGRGIDAYGTLTAGINITLEEPRWTNGFSTNVAANAAEVFARCEAGDQVSLTGGLSSPNISLGGITGNRPAGVVLFNNQVATVVTNIIGGQLYKPVTFRFANVNTTIQRNSIIRLTGTDFTPASSDSMLVMFWDGDSWNEVTRAQN